MKPLQNSVTVGPSEAEGWNARSSGEEDAVGEALKRRTEGAGTSKKKPHAFKSRQIGALGRHQELSASPFQRLDANHRFNRSEKSARRWP